MNSRAKIRQQILDAALGVFRELGFERATIADISQRAGRSRVTVYKHFESKESLFLACMLPLVAAAHAELLQSLDAVPKNVAAELIEFGKRTLHWAYSDEVAASRRLVFSESHRFDLGQKAYVNGYLPTLERVESYIDRAMAADLLRRDDARAAAVNFTALLEAELLPQLIFCVYRREDELDIDAKAERAINAFIAIYGRSPRELTSRHRGRNVKGTGAL